MRTQNVMAMNRVPGTGLNRYGGTSSKPNET